MATAIRRERRRAQAPSAEYLQALKQEADAQSQTVRRRWEQIRAVRNGEYEIDIPPAYRKWTKHIRTRRVGDIISRVVATVTHGFPTVSVPPAGPTNKAQTESTTREKFANAVLQDLDSSNPPERTFIAALDHAVTYGLGVWKFLYAAEDWWDMPTARKSYKKGVLRLTEDEEKGLDAKRDEYKRGRLPFRWQAVNPFTVWPFYHGGRLSEVLEVTQRTVADVLRRYKVRYDAQTDALQPDEIGEPQEDLTAVSTNQRTVTFIEHWDETYVSYMADNLIVAQWPHGYGRVPYFPFYGRSNYSKPTGQRGESVVEHAVDLEQALDLFLTLKSNWAYMTAMCMLILRPDANSPFWQTAGPEEEGSKQAPEPIQFQPGVATTLPPGWTLEAFTPPPVGKDLNDSIQYFTTMLADIIPQVLRGIASGTDQPGYAINQLLTAAKLVFDPVTDNAAEALMDMVSFLFWLVEHKARTKVYVLAEDSTSGASQRQWIGLSPDDINGYYANVVNVKSLLPSNAIAEGQFGLSLWQANAIDHATFLEKFAHFENPEEIIQRVLVDEYRNSEPIKAWITAKALEFAGMDEEIQQAQEEAALAGVNLPPGIVERLATGQPPGAEGGLPGQPPLAPMPGQGMPLTPPEPTAPSTLGGGMPGGRAAGMGIQPNTQGLPGGIPTNS